MGDILLQPPQRPEPHWLAGAPGQVCVAGFLACAMALWLAGWHGAVTALALSVASAAIILPRATGSGKWPRFGLANGVTLSRLAVTAVVLGAAVSAAAGPEKLSTAEHWAVFALALAALLADGVDGPIARRRGEADAFGARFDMETDAVFMLALSAFVWHAGEAGAWVLVAGLLRYAFVAAASPLPWLGAPLTPSLRRRVACAIGAGGLIAAAAPIWPQGWSNLPAATATLALAVSFAIDVQALYHAKQDRAKAVEETDVMRTVTPEAGREAALGQAFDSGDMDRVAILAHRAIGDLRRGLPVALTRQGGVVALACAVEAGGGPAALARVAPDLQPVLAITRTRARRLGLADPGKGTAVVLSTPGGFTQDAVIALADPEAPAPDLAALTVRPADPAAEAAVGLVKAARLLPTALIAYADRTIAPAGLSALDIAVWQAFAEKAPGHLTLITRARVPLEGAEEAEMVVFRPADGGKEHVAIVIGTPDPSRPVLARLHSECFTGDLMGSLRCDCGDQLRGAIAEIDRAGGGVLLYLAQEGRGIGLVNKLRAYRLQDDGFDTVDANELLGFDADERVYAPAAAMLRTLGFMQVRLMTNNPEKLAGLGAHGVTVTERVAHAFPANGHNAFYLQTKAERSGHML